MVNILSRDGKFAAPTSGTTVAFRRSGLATTPVACKVYAIKAIDDCDVDDANQVATLAHSRGFCNGSAQGCVSLYSQDALIPATNTKRQRRADRVVTLLDDVGAEILGLSFNSFLADNGTDGAGVLFNVDQVGASGWVIVIKFYLVGTHTIGVHTTNATIDDDLLENVGHPVQLVECIGVGSSSTSVLDGLKILHGYAAINPGDVSVATGVSWFSPDGVLTTTCAIRDTITNTLTEIDVVTPSGGFAEVNITIVSNGFESRPKAQNQAHTFLYMASDFDVGRPWVGTITSKTTAGNGQLHSEVGLQPESVEMLCTGQRDNGTLYVNAASSTYGIAFLDGTLENMLGCIDDDAATTSDTSSLWATNAVRLYFATSGAPTIDANFVAFASTGFTLDYVVAVATPRNWPSLALILKLLADVTASASVATVDIDAQRIVQTSVAVQASVATVDIDAQRISIADVIAPASVAIVDIDAQRISVAAVTAQAGAATSDIDAKRIVQTSVAVQAGVATASITAQRVVQTVVAVQANPATVDIDVTKISLGTVTAQASAATTAVDAQRILRTSLAVQAGVTDVSLTAQRIVQTSVTVQAGATSVDIDAQRISVADVTASASVATVDIDAQRISVADVTAQASVATVDVDAQRIVQTSVAVQAGAATTDIDASVGVISASVDATADAATTSISAQRISRATVAAQASAADVSLTAQRIVQTSVTVQADAATTAISATVFQSTATVDATADAATTSISAQRISRATVAVQASVATVDISAQRISVADVDADATVATVDLTAQRIVQTSVAVQAGAATVDVNGTVARVVTGTASVQAGAATATIQAQRIVQTSVAASAGAATCAVDADVEAPTVGNVDAAADAAATQVFGQRIVQTTVAVQAGAATVVINTAFGVEASVDADAEPATAQVLGQRVVQGGVNAVASASRVHSLNWFIPGTQTAPAVLFKPTAGYPVIVDNLPATLFFVFNRQHRTGTVSAAASPATAFAQGVIL